MGRMFNPPHPGEIIKQDILPELSLSVTEAALQLSITRVALSRVINGRATISTELAPKLEAWLDGASADVWLRMQLDYDLWNARNKTQATASTR
ncbi:MAG: HigA family addiction module antitoxin [Candidatus Methylumidiphilus sp.]